jgi:hypothetical protein
VRNRDKLVLYVQNFPEGKTADAQLQHERGMLLQVLCALPVGQAVSDERSDTPPVMEAATEASVEL